MVGQAAKHSLRKARKPQTGVAASVLLALAGLLVVLLVLGITGSLSRQQEADRRTGEALAQAKAALIGYAARNFDRPGVLPCPDNNNDGTADAPCGATGVTAMGRLPWRTLGLSDLRDGSGECLWYAVSANFKNSGTSAPAVVNSDSSGTLIVNNTSGTPINSGTNAALAIVFAPGSPLLGQDRSSSSTTVCGGNTTVANYLEGSNEEGATTNTFVTGESTSAFNDKLLPITSHALFAVVSVRVAREVGTALQAYYDTNLYFPNANSFDATSPPGDQYGCRNGVLQGRIPLTIRNPPHCDSQEDWDPANSLPAWFSTNQWNRVLFYAVASSCASAVDSLCGTPGGSLDIKGSPVRALLISTGRGFNDQTNRPCGASNCTVTDLLEDPENSDGDDFFVKPVLSPTNNDRLVVVAP